MPLPFLSDSKKKIADVAMATRRPDEDKLNENEGLQAAAHDILSAIQSKDVKALALALQAAFELCETPEEGPALPDSE